MVDQVQEEIDRRFARLYDEIDTPCHPRFAVEGTRVRADHHVRNPRSIKKRYDGAQQLGLAHVSNCADGSPCRMRSHSR